MYSLLHFDCVDGILKCGLTLETILVVLLLGIRFPTISYKMQFEKSFITILIKSNLKWPDLMCHHSSNYIPGMNINGDQSTQDVSCKFRKLSTNQCCQFVQVLGKTKYKVFHYSLSVSCRVFAFCSKVNEMSLFLLKRARKRHVTLSRVGFLTRSHFARSLSLGLFLISEKNNNTLVVYMTIFFSFRSKLVPRIRSFQRKGKRGIVGKSLFHYNPRLCYSA